ncbi:MAG TPA: cytochrome c [Phenylobacterium sp.]|nr:cytochrome c [Phenylobacterium sp.]
MLAQVLTGGWSAAALLAASAPLAGCQREYRDLSPPPETAPRYVEISDLRPGGEPPPPADPRDRQFEGNAFHIANGQRYFQWFNCTGCHANGGGGIGPALIDQKWRYGGRIEQIYASIAQGRPNGMPSFGGKIPPGEIWELAAYVRALSGQANKLAAPSRPDAMSAGPPINNADAKPQQGDAADVTAGGG